MKNRYIMDIDVLKLENVTIWSCPGRDKSYLIVSFSTAFMSVCYKTSSYYLIYFVFS